MKKEEIDAKWEQDRPMYEAWCGYISGIVKKHCATEDYAEIITVRTKTPDSLAEKILNSEKGYEDVYDKVGMRFVVLAEKDISTIVNYIYLKSDRWSIEHKRIEADNRCNAPDKFGYQSDHYIVKNQNAFMYHGANIDKNVCCEIQIRTMLQHAIGQLSHHHIYKKGYTHANIIRSLAKCQALAEVIDDSFTALIEDIKMLDDPRKRAYLVLEELYREHINKDITVDNKAMAILDDIKPYYFGDAESKLNTSNIVSEFNSRIKDKYLDCIKEQRENHQLFKHPVILLVYLIIDMCDYSKDAFPFLTESLQIVYADVGKDSGGGE